MRALTFNPVVTRQEAINWRIRFIEGDMTDDERMRFLAALAAPPAPLTNDERAAWLAGLDEVEGVELNGVIGIVAHLAYHVGAIRQIDRSLRGPSAEQSQG